MNLALSLPARWADCPPLHWVLDSPPLGSALVLFSASLQAEFPGVTLCWLCRLLCGENLAFTDAMDDFFLLPRNDPNATGKGSRIRQLPFLPTVCGVSEIPQGSHEELTLSHCEVVKIPRGENLQPDLQTKLLKTQCIFLAYLQTPWGPV